MDSACRVGDTGRLTQLQNKVFALLAAAIVATPLSGKAEETWDNQSYWFGFMTGSSATVCELLDLGLLSKKDAREWIVGLFEKNQDVPDVSRQAALEAFAKDESYKSCPVPR
jgi:hypothetical protein